MSKLQLFHFGRSLPSLQGGYQFGPASKIEWMTIAIGGVFLNGGQTSFEAELAGAEGLLQALLRLFDCTGNCGSAPTWISEFAQNSHVILPDDSGPLHAFPYFFPEM
eukprot:gnl/MRDRNA2_/MRDRNA2_33155_c0_seq1.p1 gnl/MRDRNA2_/MRDRNA2_33155_c0~~gnl/MRDRNA2_/MRDRNA2_33155_c0_seq1.p1  ORF type:complete len:107 (+),score=18.20 gnl/MRDRNA2_/MRDRNA2_33155_c0_seq1:337-657(+)